MAGMIPEELAVGPAGWFPLVSARRGIHDDQADLVAALGALDRNLYVVPARRLIVVRMGQAADRDLNQQLWMRLMKAAPPK